MKLPLHTAIRSEIISGLTGMLSGRVEPMLNCFMVPLLIWCFLYNYSAFLAKSVTEQSIIWVSNVESLGGRIIPKRNPSNLYRLQTELLGVKLSIYLTLQIWSCTVSQPTKKASNCWIFLSSSGHFPAESEPTKPDICDEHLGMYAAVCGK